MKEEEIGEKGPLVDENGQIIDAGISVQMSAQSKKALMDKYYAKVGANTDQEFLAYVLNNLDKMFTSPTLPKSPSPNTETQSTIPKEKGNGLMLIIGIVIIVMLVIVFLKLVKKADVKDGATPGQSPNLEEWPEID